MSETTVLIVEDSPQMRESLRKAVELEDDMIVVGEAGDGQTAIELARRLRPNVILMDINMPKLDGISATSEIVQLIKTRIVIISVEGEHEYFRRAMQAGACDFLVKPFTANDVISAIRRAQVVQEAAPATAAQGRLITFFSGKGGVGTTTMGINVGVALARAQCSTLILDLNLEFGDMPAMTGVEPKDDLGSLCASQQAVTPELVERVATKVEDNLWLLAAPSSPDRVSQLMTDIRQHGDFIERVVEAARGRYQYVILDVPSSFGEVTMLALDRSDLIILVSTQEMTSLHNAGKILTTLIDRLEYDRRQLKLVINRFDPRSEISARDIAEGLGHDVFSTIPCDWKASLLATNMGHPLLMNRRQNDVSQAIKALAKRLENMTRSGDSSVLAG